MTYNTNTVEGTLQITIPNTKIKNTLTGKKYKNTTSGIYKYTDKGVKKQLTPLHITSIVIDPGNEAIQIQFQKDDTLSYTLTTSITLQGVEQAIRETLPANYFISGAAYPLYDIINLLMYDIYSDEDVMEALAELVESLPTTPDTPSTPSTPGQVYENMPEGLPELISILQDAFYADEECTEGESFEWGFQTNEEVDLTPIIQNQDITGIMICLLIDEYCYITPVINMVLQGSDDARDLKVQTGQGQFTPVTELLPDGISNENTATRDGKQNIQIQVQLNTNTYGKYYNVIIPVE